MTLDGLTHLDENGNARMVDVSDKAETKRTAIAEGFIAMQPETLQAITEGKIKKGDVFAAARIAGIMAAKKTSDLIPLCHPLALTKVEVICNPTSATNSKPAGVQVQATASLVGKTGVEMEALTACGVACLTIYDMCKAIDRGMEIQHVHLLRKEGGKTGLWDRNQETSVEALPADNAQLPCGRIRSLNISKRKGTRKKPVEEGAVTLQENWGIIEDAHAGDWHRQVSILAWESIVTAQGWGLDVKEGDFAENITSEGLNLLELPLGTQVQIGDTLMELSQIGKVCHTRCAIYYQAGDCIFPREGIFLVVLKGGTIKVGDSIQVIKMGDGTCSHTPPEALAEIKNWNAEEAQRLSSKDHDTLEPPTSSDEVCDTARIAQKVWDLEKQLNKKNPEIQP